MGVKVKGGGGRGKRGIWGGVTKAGGFESELVSESGLGFWVGRERESQREGERVRKKQARVEGACERLDRSKIDRNSTIISPQDLSICVTKSLQGTHIGGMDRAYRISH
eukprot:6189430-Pleurochrysis_carterae.AAC.3